MFNFLGKIHPIFQSGCPILHCYQQEDSSFSTSIPVLSLILTCDFKLQKQELTRISKKRHTEEAEIMFSSKMLVLISARAFQQSEVCPAALQARLELGFGLQPLTPGQCHGVSRVQSQILPASYRRENRTMEAG